uniref:Uncharacterized protein n=1 Tax=viral metagenome TaxID=1070528 RepID=A0A6H1Z5T7_9ZZZZ
MEKSKGIFQLEKVVESGFRAGLMGLLTAAEALREIRDGNIFLPEGYKTFREYVEKRWGIKKSKAYMDIDIDGKVGDDIRNNAEFHYILPTRLYQALPLITDSNKLEILHDAAHIPDREGWENQLRNRKGVIATDECEHAFEPFLEKCFGCGKTRRFKEDV